MGRYIEIADQSALDAFFKEYDSFHDWEIKEVRVIDHTCFGSEKKFMGDTGDALQLRIHESNQKLSPVEVLMVGVLKMETLETGNIINAVGNISENVVFEKTVIIHFDNEMFECRKLFYGIRPEWKTLGGFLGPDLPEGL